MKMLSNPFDKYEAEDYDPESVYEMFIGDEKVIDEFAKPRHHFIWGSRGSGKSMLLRYFEPYCQFKKAGGWEKHFSNNESFIGIYCPIPRGLVSEDQFKTLDRYNAEIISSHMFNMLVAENIMKTVCEQLDCIPIEHLKKVNFANNFIDIIYASQEHIDHADKCFNRSEHPLQWVYEFIKQEKQRVVKYTQYYPFRKHDYSACLTDYHDFIVPFVKSLKVMLEFNNSIMIMFDDAGFLSEGIQKKINTWISNRDHCDINVKVASEPLHYKSFLTSDGLIVERIHDFEDIYLEWQESSASKTFDLIAEKRLRIFGMGTTDIKVLFPEDVEQSQLLSLSREEAANELKKPENKHIKDHVRYVNRVSIHLLHKKLGEKRTRRNYAGYKNIAYLSFGNIRSFLRVSRHIIDAAKVNDLSSLMKDGYYVEASIQDKAITHFSQKEFSEIKSYKPGEKQAILEGLYIMIQSLCEFFKYRLKNMSLVEAGITAFVIKNSDALEEQFKEILRAAINYRYLIRKTYRTKDGLGREEAYSINRLLIPAFNLEPTPFAGRIILSKTLFEVACRSNDEFISLMKEEIDKNSKNASIQLTLFNEKIIDDSEGLEELYEYNENDLSGLF